MKICIVAYKFGTEKEIGEHLGTYHYFIEITRNLVNQGHKIFVVAPWISFTQKGSVNVDGVRILRYFPPLWNKIYLFPVNRLMRWWYLKATQKQILKLQKKEDLDTVFVWQARETAYAVAKIRSKLKCSFLFRQITTWNWHLNRSAEEVFQKKSWYKFFKKIKVNKFVNIILEFLLDKKSQKKYADLIYKKADQVVFVSQIASEEAVEMGLDQDKVETLPVTIETDEFKPLYKKIELRQDLKLNGDKIILFIGRINFAEKGIGYLIEAMPQIISKISKVNLVIIGADGEWNRMVNMVDELELKNNIQLVGRKPYYELKNYINASDVFVTPSVWLETFGQVTIQGMSCAVPVVTSDAGASPEINIDGQTGFVVPKANSEKLAEAIIKILEDEDLQKKLGDNARQRVIENYTYEVLINKMIKIIQDAKNKQ